MPMTVDEQDRQVLLNPQGAHLNLAASGQPAANAVPWVANTKYEINERIFVPTSNGLAATVFYAQNAGTTGGSAPTWSRRTAAVTTDNGISWVSIGDMGLQYVPDGYQIPETATRSLANRPWSQRGRAQYIGYPIVTASLSNVDETTPPSYFATPKTDPKQGGIDLSLSGTWDGTVSLERCFNADCQTSAGAAVSEVWNVVDTYTQNVEKVIQHFNPSAKWRLRFSTANSGTVIARLSQA